MDDREIRLRCIEAAAKTPANHQNGHAAGVLETAKVWATWVVDSGAATPAAVAQGSQLGKTAPLGLPNKK